MMRCAIFAGTFDPPTLAHQNIVERASALFDHLVIAVAKGHHKSPLLSQEERMQLWQEILPSLHLNATVEIMPLNTLLVDLCEQTQIFTLIRGVRHIEDLNFETQLFNVNHQLNPKIDTLFLPTLPQFSATSSTFVREILLLKGKVSSFISPVCEKFLLAKLENK